jgi:CHAT domain-containing protein
MQFRSLDENKSSILLSFAPGFTDRQKQKYRVSVADSLQLDNKFLTYIQQPFAVETAKNIAGTFSGAAFVEEKADETTFKKESGKYGIIHLGTHAEMNMKSPLMSHLVFSKNILNDSLDDGYLHAYEIYQMPLRAELAVLTACETGVGQQRNSEGVISLAHSFSYAGCPAIVMSLWSIDEKTSAGIIDDFYHYLAAGLKKNEALRQAKLDYLNHAPKELQSPYYWAGLVLLGDQRPVEIRSKYNWDWISAFGILCLLLLIYFIMRNRELFPAKT